MQKCFKIFSVYFLLLLSGVLSASGQVYAPEGMNMPGAYNGWNNPPTINAFAGILKVGGTFLLDTSLATRRYLTTIHVESSGADIAAGAYEWKFSSGPLSDIWRNTWGGVAVKMDTLQTYVNGGPNNSVTVSNGKYYTIVYKDNGYQNTDAIWMVTSALPVTIPGVSQTPPNGSVSSTDTVKVQITLSSPKSNEERIYVRYSTDNWSTSALAEANFSGGTSGSAVIPPQAGGTAVSYYVFSTTQYNPSSSYDIVTLSNNNNGKLNYFYSVNASSYRIITSAGPHGAINPQDTVIVNPGGSQHFSITPDPGYYTDSLIVDNELTDSAMSYTFTNVHANHTIRATFTQKVNVTFQVNMKIQMQNGDFMPGSGDAVTVRGSFNDWGNSTGNPDTLRESGHDSIYSKTILMKANQSIAYKFWKTERNGLGYESFFPDRSFLLQDSDTLVPVAYFNNSAVPNLKVTFRLNMGIQMLLDKFRPGAGDIVTVRGSFNDWGNSTGNPDTLTDNNHDSIYTKTVSIRGDQTIEYKFWKSDMNITSGYENCDNRSSVLGEGDTTLPVMYFGNDSGYPVTILIVSSGWNMISLPRVVSNALKSALFPGAASAAFKYTPAGYRAQDTLRNGEGYWLKFPRDTAFSIIGEAVPYDTITLAGGWNLIGPFTYQVPVDSISAYPPGIVSSEYFWYSKAYVNADTLKPGRAYWVKTKQAGTLYFKAHPGAAAYREDVISPDEFGQITVSDASGRSQTLYVTDNAAMKSFSKLELPPAPPDGAFDVRFATNRLIEAPPGSDPAEIPLIISSATYPVTLSWNLHGLAAMLKISGKTIPAADLGSLHLSDPAARISVTLLGSTGIPQEYALGQNFPNPFNPATYITYALPVNALVTLKIYNYLGQEVATLVNGIQEAGYKSVLWSSRDEAGRGLASGVYFYRIEASGLLEPGRSFTQVKRMLMIK